MSSQIAGVGFEQPALIAIEEQESFEGSGGIGVKKLRQVRLSAL
jgi:hypothetical protein